MSSDSWPDLTSDVGSSTCGVTVHTKSEARREKYGPFIRCARPVLDDGMCRVHIKKHLRWMKSEVSRLERLLGDKRDDKRVCIMWLSSWTGCGRGVFGPPWPPTVTHNKDEVSCPECQRKLRGQT